MASFDSAGAGFARGLRGGLEIATTRQQLRERRQADERARIQQSIKDSEENAVGAFNTFLEIIQKTAPNTEPDDPRFQQMVSGAIAPLIQHGQLMENIRRTATEVGIPEEIVAELPTGQQFVERHLGLLQATIDQAVLAREAEPLKETSFFAQVDGFEDSVRVTERKTPDGTKFFVGDTEVPAAAVGQPIQQRQEVGELQIPGLTPEQSGKEITTLRQMGAANRAFAGIANQMARDVVDRPERVGTVGDVIRGFSSLVSQAEGLANVLGLDARWVKEDGSAADIDDFDFRGLAEESAETKRTILDLVFLDLNSKGQTGRAISDKDLQIFLDRTGIDSGDPNQVIAGLRRGVQNNEIALRENVEARSGGAFTLEEILPAGAGEFDDPREGNLNNALSAVDTAIQDGDIEKANAIMDAIEAEDFDKLKELLGDGAE